MISCVSTDPFLCVSDTRIHVPLYENNYLIPLQPIQKLHSFAESNQALIMSHGTHVLEFGKITKTDQETEFIISRVCQKTIDKPFKVNKGSRVNLVSISLVCRN